MTLIFNWLRKIDELESSEKPQYDHSGKHFRIGLGAIQHPAQQSLY